MVHTERCIVMDIDGTLCPIKKESESYSDLVPFPEILVKLREYRDSGFHIILATARGMRTAQGNVGTIMAKTAPELYIWLEHYGIPFDEIHFGKPWPGKGGFYVDDRSIRPSEFRDLTYAQIEALIDHEQAIAAS